MENQAEKKIFIAIPAFNEADVIQDVIQEIQSAGYKNIIIIDDGSRDNTFEKANEIAGVTTLRHKINRGKGAATKTGIEAAKLLGADIIVTMDGDGQHDPQNIKNLIEPILKNDCDVVLGTRLKTPRVCHCTNRCTMLKFFHLDSFGLWVRQPIRLQGLFQMLPKLSIPKDRYELQSESSGN